MNRGGGPTKDRRFRMVWDRRVPESQAGAATVGVIDAGSSTTAGADPGDLASCLLNTSKFQVVKGYSIHLGHLPTGHLLQKGHCASD